MKLVELFEAFGQDTIERMSKIADKTGVKDIAGARINYVNGEEYDTISMGLLFGMTHGDTSPEKVKTILPKFLKAVVKEFAVDEIQISTMVKKKDIANVTVNPDELEKLEPARILPRSLQGTFAMHINFLIAQRSGSLQ